MSGAVSKIRFSTLEEALVVRGLLDANGIEAWVGNRHHISSDRLSTPALGGVTLLVPTALLPEAHEAIESTERADPASQDKSASEHVSPRWRFWLGILILFGTPFIVIGWWGGFVAPSHYVSDSLRLPWWMIPRPPAESADTFFRRPKVLPCRAQGVSAQPP